MTGQQAGRRVRAELTAEGDAKVRLLGYWAQLEALPNARAASEDLLVTQHLAATRARLGSWLGRYGAGHPGQYRTLWPVKRGFEE